MVGSILFVEVLFEGGELVLAQDDALPPGFQEAQAVAHELGEGGGDAEQAYAEAAVLARGVDADDDGIEQQRRQGEGGDDQSGVGEDESHVAAGARGGEESDEGHDEGHEGDERQQQHADGEHHGEHVDELHGAGVALLEVDAGDAGVEHLAEELAEVLTF